MSKIKAPFYSYENPVMYCQNFLGKNNETFGNFNLANKNSYINLDFISVLLKNSCWQNNVFNNHLPNYNVSLKNSKCLTRLGVPNSEESGGPNPPTNTKIFSSNFEDKKTIRGGLDH